MIFETNKQLHEYADGKISGFYIDELWKWLCNQVLKDDEVKKIIDNWN